MIPVPQLRLFVALWVAWVSGFWMGQRQTFEVQALSTVCYSEKCIFFSSISLAGRPMGIVDMIFSLLSNWVTRLVIFSPS